MEIRQAAATPPQSVPSQPRIVPAAPRVRRRDAARAGESVTRSPLRNPSSSTAPRRSPVPPRPPVPVSTPTRIPAPAPSPVVKVRPPRREESALLKTGQLWEIATELRPLLEQTARAGSAITWPQIHKRLPDLPRLHADDQCVLLWLVDEDGRKVGRENLSVRTRHRRGPPDALPVPGRRRTPRLDGPGRHPSAHRMELRSAQGSPALAPPPLTRPGRGRWASPSHRRGSQGPLQPVKRAGNGGGLTHGSRSGPALAGQFLPTGRASSAMRRRSATD